MGEVRNFTEEHAEGVARLYMRAVRGQSKPPGGSLGRYFSQLHLSNPWASPDLPALVYLEKNKVVGSLGLVPRQLEFRGRPVRLATMTLFMVDPEHRNGLAAVHLLGKALKGPQDIMWTDGASGSVASLWNALGGYRASPYASNWTRILRTCGTARLGLARMGRPGWLLKPIVGLLAPAGDYLLSQVPMAALRAPESPFHTTPVSATELLGCIQELGWRECLKPLYSPETFPWLIDQASQSRLGTLRLMTVCNDAGERCGWFVYYSVPAGASFVLQIGVRRKDDFRNTLLSLFHDAWSQGAVCVKGASIPQHMTTMTEMHCIFRYPYDRALVHSRNAEMVNEVRTGDAALTRMDGIGWLRFPAEKWDQ
jgi:hypothetical protein